MKLSDFGMDGIDLDVAKDAEKLCDFSEDVPYEPRAAKRSERDELKRQFCRKMIVTGHVGT